MKGLRPREMGFSRQVWRTFSVAGSQQEVGYAAPSWESARFKFNLAAFPGCQLPELAAEPAILEGYRSGRPETPQPGPQAHV